MGAYGNTPEASRSYSADVSVVAVLSPDGGEAWRMGTEQLIRWSSSGVTGDVKIELYKGAALAATIDAATRVTRADERRACAARLINEFVRCDGRVRASVMAEAIEPERPGISKRMPVGTGPATHSEGLGDASRPPAEVS